MRRLFLEGEVELYMRAWQQVLEASEETLSVLLASKVKDLHPSSPFDADKAKIFLAQYPPKPPPLKTASQTVTKPVNFEFNGCIYDMSIEGKLIKHWTECWLKFCYVLREALNDDAKFLEVLSYRLPNRSPFWDSPDRWRKGRAHLIKGTHIYVYPYMPADKIKEEIEVLSKHFGYDPPRIKENLR